MSNNEILSKIENLSDESISNILEVLEKLNVDNLIEAQAFPGRAGQTIEVKDPAKNKYYIGLSEYGFVEIIRSDTPTGKIVYMPLDD